MTDILNKDIEACRNGIREKYGIPEKNVFITATHTHSAPNVAGFEGWGDVGRPYVDKIMLPAMLEASKAAVDSMKPAVIGMIGTAVLSIGKTVFVQPGVWVSAGIFAVMAVLAFKKVHPIIIICISAAAGILAGVLGF